MKLTRILSAMLVLTMVLCLLPMGAVEAEAATTVIHQANDTTETVLTNYDVRADNVDNQNGYSNLQTGTAMSQDGFFDKNKGLAVTWMIQAPEAGVYTFDPYYYIGNFGALKGGIYNMVWCVNDTHYYLGADITGDTIGTHKVTHGMDVVELPLEKGVNIVRMLPVAGPNYVYQKVDRGDGNVVATYVNIYKVGIDSRLTVRKAAPMTVSFEMADKKNSEFNLNQFSTGTADYGFLQPGSTYTKENYQTFPDYDTLNQSNLSKIPYVSYTLNAPEDGWYDMTMNLSLATFSKYGNDGYVIVRVNGVNYKRWLHATNTTHPYETNTNGTAKSWPFSDQNISVPLKKGVNTVVVTCAVGLKGGTDSSNCETTVGGYGLYTRIKKLTVYGGVTVATKLDPTTVPDAPLPTTTLEAETYGAGFNGYTVSGDKLLSGNITALTGLPTLRSLWGGAAFQKSSAPYAAFTVDVPVAGTYTLRADYTLTAATGADALDYYMSASVNDQFYDKARFEPAQALSRTVGYSDLVLELEAGVNVIRLLPVLDGNPAAGVDLDKITITGSSKVTGIAPGVTVLKSAQAQYHNGFTADGDLLTGSTGEVATYAALNSVNIKQTGWFAYTVNVPKAGYYDLHVNVGSGGTGDGSLVLVINGEKEEISTALGKAAENNTLNLSRYFAAGEHTILITGVLGQETTMGALTVCGGITLAETQVDPLTLGVTPAVKEGGLVPGSAYTEQKYKISNVPAGATVQEFASNFLDITDATVLDANGEVMADSQQVTAGCGVLYPNGTYYEISSVSQTQKRSVGASYLLQMCNPVGRMLQYKNAMLMESSASNFTLSGNLSGDVTMTVNVDNQYTSRELHSIFIEVDGVTSYINLKEGLQTVTLASGLSAAKHTIKVSKGSEAYRDDMYIHSVTYTGTLQKAQAATRRIEFLGDSITAGSGVFFQHCGYGPTHSYFSYANMTADALGADYYSVANGGWRFTSTFNSSSSIATIYPYVSMHEDLGEYDNSQWQPDVIVINLGTNDAIGARSDTTNYTAASFEENIFIMLDLVRQKNPDAEIIWAYGMMLSEKKEWIQSAVEKYALQDSKVHYVYCQPNTKGQGNHPNFEGSTTNADILVEAICEIMDWEVPTGTHATGDCGGAAACEFCRHNELTLPTHVYTDDCDTQCDLTYVSESNGSTLECKHTRTAPHYSADCTSTTCDNCGKDRQAEVAHSYTDACDTTCDNPDCQVTRTAPHDFSGACDEICNNPECGLKRTGTAHDFDGDVCAVCGANREAPQFSGASITLTDDLNLNFKVDPAQLEKNGYEDAYVVFEFCGQTITVTEPVEKDGILSFTYPGIAPHQMAETMTATLYLTLDGATVSHTTQYSVADYCTNMLAKCTGEEYRQLRTLLVDMLYYGAAAQQYVDPSATELVTDILTDAQKAERTQTDRTLTTVTNAGYETVVAPQAQWNSASLVLKDAVKVRLKFAAESTDGMTVEVKVGDRTYILSGEDIVPAETNGNYYVVFDELDASQLSEELYITVCRGGEKVSNTLRYSVESYACAKQNDPDAKLQALVKAIMRYGDAASAYVNSSKQATFEKKQYSADGITMNYWLHTPRNATANMPLIVYLHGGSGKGDDLDLITAVDGFPKYLQDGQIAPNAYVIIPQLSSSYKGWGGPAITDLVLTISSVQAQYQIDANRISLTGHSMGGTGVWSVALGNADLFSAIAPLSGSVTLSDANIQTLSNMPVWAVVGAADTIVDPQSSIDFIAALSQVNEKALITTLAGVDHFTVPSSTYLATDFDIISWLISQSKKMRF